MDCEILGLTETWHTSLSSIEKFTNQKFHIFDSTATKEKSKGRPSGGIIVLINKSFNINKINLISKTNLYIVVEIVVSNISFVIGCFYMSPLLCDNTCDELLDQTFLELTPYKKSRIIILGDLNCRFGQLNQMPDHSPGIDNTNLSDTRLSNDKKTNRRGILMIETLEFHGFTILNGRSKSDCPANFTFVAPQGRSVIDVVWVNDQALVEILDFEVLYTNFISDHFPCLVKINSINKPAHLIRANPSKVTKLKWNNNKALEYLNSMAETVASPGNFSLSDMLNSIKETASRLEMEKTYLATNHEMQKNPWFNRACRESKRAVSKAAKTIKKIT